MKRKYLSLYVLGVALAAVVAGCSEEEKNPIPPAPDSTTTGVDLTTDIPAYNGETADDADKDVAGSNNDFYWEANSFTEKVEIVYKDNEVDVTTSDPSIAVHSEGAYVTVDFLTSALSGVEIVVRGTSSDGALKIYGAAKTLLTLDGLSLTSKRGPAINNQCKKRLFVRMSDGSVNTLADANEYIDDPFYLPGASSLTEDRKGCLFSEGNLIFSGRGSLRLKGNCRHGIVTDGYLYTRPGVTLVVEDAVRNAIHVKGDVNDGYGIHITGGYIYARTAGAGGRAMKTDLGVNVYGGKVNLYTTGDAVYDEESLDLQSAAGIKAGANVNLAGGEVNIISKGKGGKGINTNGSLYISGANVKSVAMGDEAVDTARGLSSSPKGLKADANVVVSNGELMSYATDDALSANACRVSGGSAWCFSIDKDAVDVAETFSITRGLIIASGDGGNASGIEATTISVQGGTLIATGGTQDMPADGSRPWVSASLDNLKLGDCIGLKSGDRILMNYILPRDLNSAVLLYSAEDLPVAGSSVSLLSGGTGTAPGHSWNGLITGYPSYTGGSSTELTVK